MLLDEIASITWLMPWQPADPGLELELAKEIGREHALYRRKAISVARRVDNDDVLFFLPENPAILAVVHLTWKGSTEVSAQWPITKFYFSVSDWVENCMQVDHIA